MAGEKSGFTAEERAAMRQRAKESKAALEGAEALQSALDAIAALDDIERPIAERLHAIVQEVAPQLSARTYYGFPAYAKDGKVVVFYQPAAKFKTRYGTVSFSDVARIDDGEMWPVSYAVIAMNETIAANIATLVKKAAA
ncbi:hypothetical protein BH11ACT2_BH11ACT2_09800 [soil metagenome]